MTSSATTDGTNTETNGHSAVVVRAPRPKNTRQVLHVLRRTSPITQVEIAERTELSRRTVESIVRRLYERRLIESVRIDSSSADRSEGGRPPSAIRLRGDAASALSVDFGLRHVCVARGNLGGVTFSQEDPSEIDVAHDASTALEAAVRLVEIVTKGMNPRDLVGVCIGLPAPIDQKREQIASTRGITSWTGIRPTEELRYRLGPAWDGVPFILENDANLAALAEYEFGAAKQSQDGMQDIAIVVKWSDGIGGAVLINGVPVIGHRGLAVEFGHTVLDIPHDQANLPAPCSRCGHVCLERLSGGMVLTDRLRKSGSDTFSDVIHRAIHIDGPERQGIRQAAEYIGHALGLYVTLLNPRIVIINGRHFGSGPSEIAAYRIIVDSIRDGMRKIGFPSGLEDVDLVLGESQTAVAEGGIVAMMRSRLDRHLEAKVAQG
jgi:predicted NBD/HSP70 family sugar kinase